MKVNGNIISEGINLLLAGIYQAVQNQIEIRDAALTVIGTAEDDSVHVVAHEGAGDITIETGKGNDDVITEAGGEGEITISTGDGSDTVTLTVPEDEEEEDEDGTEEAGEDGEDGEDGENGENGEDGEAGEAGEDGEDGEDGENGEEDENEPEKPVAISVDTGAGDDRVNVDIAIGGNYEEVNIEDEDSARIHFIGELTDDEEQGDPITASEDAQTLSFTNKEGGTLRVNMEHVRTRKLSDELENKREGEIDLEDQDDNRLRFSDDHTVVWFDADGAFTNYILKNSLKDIHSFVLRLEGDGLLNQLIIDGEDAADDNGRVVVQDVLAEKMNLIIRGEKIDVLGTLFADNIEITAEAESVHADIEEGQSKLDKIESTYESMKADLFNVTHKVEINIAENARVYAYGDVILEASVEQSGSIMDVDAFTDVLNLVNVKVGSAKVNVKGGIHAGSRGEIIYNEETNTYTYVEDEEETENASSGSIRIATKVNTEVEAGTGNGYLSSLAVAVAVINSEINISGATLKAAEDIVAQAKGTVKVQANAVAADLPVSLGVVAVASDVHTDAIASTLTAGGSVTLNAEGEVEIENKASKDGGDDDEDGGDDDKDGDKDDGDKDGGDGDKDDGEDKDGDEDDDGNKSGGYFVVSVLNQDVRARVAGGTAILAGGDVNVHAAANADVKSKAVSASDEDDGDDDKDDGEDDEEDGDNEEEDAPKSVGSVKDFARQILEIVVEEVDLGAVADKLLAGLKSADYKVKTASTNDESKGMVSLSRSSANKGAEVDVTAQPKEGYVLDSITIRYLEPGKDHYTTKTLDLTDKEVHPEVGSDYYFDMPGSDAEVLVTFREKTASDAEEVTGDDLANLFGDPDDEGKDASQVADVGSVFDQATGGATKEKASPTGILIKDSEAANAIELKYDGNDEEKGSLLAAEEVKKAAPGDKIQIIVNPPKTTT